MLHLKRPFPQDHDDIWQQREGEIRELYQVQRKTLKEVKETMEGLGFPKLPLSTWESKLRDVLQVRKKVKGSDWPTIYRHLLPRLERPGKKKAKRPTAIYLNHTQIPWEKAWKEVRRSGVLGRSPHQGPLSPLPTYISVRTPSPHQSPVPLLEVMRPPSPFNLEPSAHQLEMMNPRSPSQGTRPWSPANGITVHPIPGSTGIEVTLDSEARRLSILNHIRDVPWLQMSRTLRDCLSSFETMNVFNSPQDIGIPIHLIPLNLQAYSDYKHTLSVKVLLEPAADTAMVHSADVFHYMSTAIYLLSNRLVSMEDEALACLLKTLSERIPRSLLYEILKTPLPAIRAAWEVLIRFEATMNFDSLFNLLVNVGIHNDWLDVERMGHDYLFYAVRAKCFDAMEKLLAHGCRPDSSWLHEKDSAILKAIQGGDLDAARLLMRYCDVNRTFSLFRNPSTVGQSTNFLMFMYQFNKYDHRHRCVLKLFLDHGARSDAPWYDSSFHPRQNPAMLEFYKLNSISIEWSPTILDYYFFVDRYTYRVMRRHDRDNPGRRPAARNNRSEILRALKQGNISRVKSLLSSINEEIENGRQISPTCDQHFPHVMAPQQGHNGPREDDWELHPIFELLFVEQLLFGGVWYKDKLRPGGITWELIDLRVDLNFPSFPNTDVTELLCAALALISTTTELSRGMEGTLLKLCSLHQNSVSWSKVFLAAARTKNAELFRLLFKIVPDAGKNGDAALREAVQRHDYEAVDLLLALGVDIWSLAAIEGHYASAHDSTASTHGRASTPYAKVDLSDRMIEYLREKGLDFQQKVERSDPNHKLKDLFKHGSKELFQRAKHLLDKMSHLNGHLKDTLPSYLLELCLRGPAPWKERQQRLKVFELCFRHGAKLSPGSPVSTLIYAGGRTELIHELLDMDVEVNAYSHDMDSEFPKLSEPWSLTPLQAAAFCGNETIVNELLKRGADVNAPALGRLGKTALQNICAWMPGTSEERERKNRIVLRLLEHGADVNNAPADWCGRTALQIAATEGELELVALLLERGADVNAPPCRRQGWVALDGAAYKGRLDVVKLLVGTGARSAYGGSTGYDGAIECAKHCGHFAVAELIGAHAREVASAEL